MMADDGVSSHCSGTTSNNKRKRACNHRPTNAQRSKEEAKKQRAGCCALCAVYIIENRMGMLDWVV